MLYINELRYQHSSEVQLSVPVLEIATKLKSIILNYPRGQDLHIMPITVQLLTSNNQSWWTRLKRSLWAEVMERSWRRWMMLCFNFSSLTMTKRKKKDGEIVTANLKTTLATMEGTISNWTMSVLDKNIIYITIYTYTIYITILMIILSQILVLQRP